MKRSDEQRNAMLRCEVRVRSVGENTDRLKGHSRDGFSELLSFKLRVKK